MFMLWTLQHDIRHAWMLNFCFHFVLEVEPLSFEAPLIILVKFLFLFASALCDVPLRSLISSTRCL